jgi:hypothetical protein
MATARERPPSGGSLRCRKTRIAAYIGQVFWYFVAPLGVPVVQMNGL